MTPDRLQQFEDPNHSAPFCWDLSAGVGHLTVTYQIIGGTALDEPLTAFPQVAPRQVKVVELRYFGGLTEEEIVVARTISPRTVRRDWDLGKAWLLRD